MTAQLDTRLHPLLDAAYIASCRTQLDADGVLVLRRLVSNHAIADVVRASAPREADAFYAGSSHNVYLTPRDPSLPEEHARNRQVVSSKGLIADDEVPADSPLRAIYDDMTFRSFIAGVVGVDQIYPYADDVSSINVHFAPAGCELGWHFDNSAFAITMLLQAPEAGGCFEYVANVRDSAAGVEGYDRVAAVLDGDEPVNVLEFEPGDLVLFRGRDSLHRVTPTEGDVTRILAVFAYNDEPGVTLSPSARQTFFGRA